MGMGIVDQDFDLFDPTLGARDDIFLLTLMPPSNAVHQIQWRPFTVSLASFLLVLLVVGVVAR